MKHADFVHLHLHTQYSLLDGAIRSGDVMRQAREYAMPAVAITDHGNLFGAVEFHDAALRHGVKPIIGCEVYLAEHGHRSKEEDSRHGSSYHFILLAMNRAGYKNLVRLASIAYIDGFYYRPRIDFELLESHSEGLIGMSACLSGPVARPLQSGDREKARGMVTRLRRIFPGRFYLELQRHDVEGQTEVNSRLIDLAREFDVPLVATNDCHYLQRDEANAHDTLLAIQTGKVVSDPNRLRFGSDQHYFKSPDEMRELFSDLPEALRSTIEIAERCNLEFKFERVAFPQFEIKPGMTLDQHLDHEAREGLAVRLRESGAACDERNYYARLDYEVGIIRKTGYAAYFLIVADFINYAKHEGIPVGPGRGSAAGSLVAYALRITDIDPIRYDLLFERFLNPERVTMPDIDIDFCIEGREQVLRYVAEKYGGSAHVAQIITFGTMQARAVIRDVGRALDVPYGEVDRLAKLIPNTLNITLKEACEREPRIREQERSRPEIARLLGIARRLEGLTRHASTHAAGVVISHEPLVEHLPLYKDPKGEVMTQFDMKCIERIGLIKFDFLGLKTLTLIDRTEKQVVSTKEPQFDIQKIPLDVPAVWELLGSGDTPGIFQLESAGMTDLLVKLKPVSMKDLIALIALYRPGPLGSGMVDEFIRRRHNKVPIRYELPQLEDILKETYGIIVYQEQVMQIASVLGHFTLGEADILRRAMGKKKREEMERQREGFLKGCRMNKIPPRKAEKIFDLMAKFAEYGFNKSHSAAYAMIAYQTAFLKAHYRREFMASLLSLEIQNTDKVYRHMSVCREQGIAILPPDVNESERDFTVAEPKIRFGLAGVKNVGEGAIESILGARRSGGSFHSLLDFCERVDTRRVNKRVIESLIKCGAFDSLGATRAEILSRLDAVLEAAQRSQAMRLSGQTSLFASLPEARWESGIAEWDEETRLGFEKEALGFYLTGHPLAAHAAKLRAADASTIASLGEVRDGKEVRVAGIVTTMREVTTRKGTLMGFVGIEDLTGATEVIVFPDLYERASALLKEKGLLLVRAKVEQGEEALKLIARDIGPLLKRGADPDRDGGPLDRSHRAQPTIRLRVLASDLGEDQARALKELFTRHPGRYRVELQLVSAGEEETVLLLPDELSIEPTQGLSRRLQSLFGYPALVSCGASGPQDEAPF